MVIRKGFILVKPDIKHYDGVKIGNTFIEIEKGFNEGLHTCVSGFVEAVSESETEIKIGDELLFHYRDYPYALSDGRIYNDCFFLRREDPFLIMRNGKVIAINETVVVEPNDEAPVSKLIELPDQLKYKKSLTEGTVFVSAHSKNEMFNKLLCTGKKVIFDKVDSIPLQNTMYQKINNKGELYRMKHDDVLAILPDHE